MEEKNVFCCSCFIDQAVWYIERCNFAWEFDSFVYKNWLVSDSVFIYDKKFEINSIGRSIYYKNCITVCCLDCIKFTMKFLSGNEEFIDLLKKIDCRFVFEDFFSFDSVIYYGNDRFQFNEPRKHFSIEGTMEKFINNSPNCKSCFTSLENFYFRYFCYNCREAFMKIVPQNFYNIKNDFNLEILR